MTDAYYQKQLAAFGIDSVRITEGDINKKRQEETAEMLLGVVKNLMDRVDGRHWVYSMLEMCQTFSPPFVPGKPDVSNFFSGAQAVGIKIFNDVMKVSPEKFWEMMQEASARARGIRAVDSEE